MTTRKAKKAPARKKPAPKAVKKKAAKPVARKAVKPKAKPKRRAAAPPAARGPGRPTVYLPEYVERIISWTRETGGSLDAFAGAHEFSKPTLDNWRKVYPEFDEACKIAKAVRAFVFEQRAVNETNGPQMNYKLLALKNCAADSWREQQDHRIGGLPGAPPVATAQIDTSKMTPDQVYNYILNGAPLPPGALDGNEDDDKEDA